MGFPKLQRNKQRNNTKQGKIVVFLKKKLNLTFNTFTNLFIHLFIYLFIYLFIFIEGWFPQS